MGLADFSAASQKLHADIEKLNTQLEKVGAHMETATEGMGVLFDAVTKTAAGIDTLEGKLDKVVLDTAPKAFPILAEMLKRLAEGSISMAQFEQEYAKLQALNAQGGGFLGDLDKLLLQIRRIMSGDSDPFANAGGTSPQAPTSDTGGATASEGGAGFSGGAGGSGGFGQSAGGGPLGTQGFSGARRLVATAIDLGSGRPTASNAAQRARILHQLAQNTRNTRR